MPEPFALPWTIRRTTPAIARSVSKWARRSSRFPTSMLPPRVPVAEEEDLEWVQSFAKTPILLKGVVNPDDADHAAKAGVAGIVVSNHGGRALDGVPATIEALPVVADKVSGRIPILMDGGIRRGGDVLKALANGASAVLVGRPYLYGLGVAWSDGVRHVIEILRTEFEAAMALTGRISIGAIDRSVLWPSQQV